MKNKILATVFFICMLLTFFVSPFYYIYVNGTDLKYLILIPIAIFGSLAGGFNDT